GAALVGELRKWKYNTMWGDRARCAPTSNARSDCRQMAVFRSVETTDARCELNRHEIAFFAQWECVTRGQRGASEERSVTSPWHRTFSAIGDSQRTGEVAREFTPNLLTPSHFSHFFWRVAQIGEGPTMLGFPVLPALGFRGTNDVPKG